MHQTLLPSSLAVALLVSAGAACAQDNTFKLGLTRYDTNTKTSGISGIGVPPGADATTSDATTVIFVYERMLNPNVGVELVLGIPPKITARATGTVAFLGDDVLSARNLAPTLLFNYHFGSAGDTWRPYVGAGINWTRFTNIKSSLAPSVKMGDSTGLAVQAGVDYALSKQWGVFASVARVDVQSKLVAAGSTVLTTTIDFRPTVWSIGTSYKF